MAAEHGAVNSPDKGASPQGKAATQDRILQAAMSLFMRRGYARTSVTQIASKAGVSRAAVFWHFSDKDTLFRAAAKQFVVPFREGLARHMRHLEPRKRIIELSPTTNSSSNRTGLTSSPSSIGCWNRQNSPSRCATNYSVSTRHSGKRSKPR